jgi:hypothetical protein
VYCRSITRFAEKFKGAPDTALVLVDDYVGSGDTAKRALGELRRNWGNGSPSVVILLALAAQQRAVLRLGAIGCIVVTGQLLKRGISDGLTPASVPKALQTMDEIGRLLNMSQNYWLGYEDTEALSTFLRTPNNTFPVYWTNNKVKGDVWDSPFTRHAAREY